MRNTDPTQNTWVNAFAPKWSVVPISNKTTG